MCHGALVSKDMGDSDDIETTTEVAVWQLYLDSYYKSSDESFCYPLLIMSVLDYKSLGVIKLILTSEHANCQCLFCVKCHNLSILLLDNGFYLKMLIATVTRDMASP